MKTTIAKLSNDRLEAEISACYYRAFEEGIRVEEVEGSMLSLLWGEFDRRFELGEIERNPMTGNEKDEDDYDELVRRIYGI